MARRFEASRVYRLVPCLMSVALPKEHPLKSVHGTSLYAPSSAFGTTELSTETRQSAVHQCLDTGLPCHSLNLLPQHLAQEDSSAAHTPCLDIYLQSSLQIYCTAPVFWSSFSGFNASKHGWHLIRATPPPGTMPSSTAARVAFRASV